MTVVPFTTVEGGFDFDGMFEGLKGKDYERVLVLATSADGFERIGNVSVGEALLLLAVAHKEIVDEVEQ